MVGPSSSYGRLSEIVEGDLPSFLSFRSASGGTWAVAGCRNDVVRLAYFSQRFRQTYPDMICWSSGCDVCECRVPLSKGVRIGEAHHVYSWGNPDGANPDRNTCHVSSEGGVPTMPPFNLPILPYNHDFLFLFLFFCIEGYFRIFIKGYLCFKNFIRRVDTKSLDGCIYKLLYKNNLLIFNFFYFFFLFNFFTIFFP